LWLFVKAKLGRFSSKFHRTTSYAVEILLLAKNTPAYISIWILGSQKNLTMSMQHHNLAAKNYRMETVNRTLNMRARNKNERELIGGLTEVMETKAKTKPKAEATGKRICPPRKNPERKTREERTIEKFRNIDFFGQRDSNNILTVQNLEFPDVNVKRTELHKRDECGKVVIRARGRDFESSSNSHFRDGIETVKLRKSVCSTTSTAKKSQSDSGQNGGSIKESSEKEPDSDELVDSMHLPSTRPPQYGKRVAVKIISKVKAPSEYTQKFLPREIEAVKGLHHENLITFYQSIETSHR